MMRRVNQRIPAVLRASGRRPYFAIALFFITFAALCGLHTAEGDAPPVQVGLRDFPLHVAGWLGTQEALGSDVVDVLGLDDWLLRRYRDASGMSVWFYIGYLTHWNAARRRQTNHSPRFCYPAQGWEIARDDLVPVEVGGTRIVVNALLVQKGLEQRLVLYWFQWGDRAAPEARGYDLEAKLSWLVHLPWRLFEGMRTDRALVQISSPVFGSAAETLAAEVAFVRAVFPLLRQRFSLEAPARPVDVDALQVRGTARGTI